MSQPPPPHKISFAKPWLSYKDQVETLVGRGLVVADAKAAEKFLSHVNYFRFSGYCLAFEEARHKFRPGVTFEDVREAYDFDMQMRDLLTEALEVVEVDTRTCIAHNFGQKYGAFGYTDPANLFGNHAEMMERVGEEVERSGEMFVKHFERKYREYPNLPIWVLTEIVSFGTLTRLYRSMHKSDQKPIAQRYNVQPSDLGSMMHHFVVIRNMCAHHCRVWDRVWDVKAELPKGQFWKPPYVLGNDRLYSTLLLLNRFLKSCPTAESFRLGWQKRVFAMLEKPPATPVAHAVMGVVSTWKQNPEWK